MKIKRKHIPLVAGILIGGIAGFFYWQQVGCLGGTCPIYAVWYKSTLYGMLLGGLLGTIVQDIFMKPKPKEEATHQDS